MLIKACYLILKFIYLPMKNFNSCIVRHIDIQYQDFLTVSCLIGLLSVYLQHGKTKRTFFL